MGLDKDVENLSATELLSQCDSLLYDLLSCDGAGSWIDASQFNTKEVLKLKNCWIPSQTFLL